MVLRSFAWFCVGSRGFAWFRLVLRGFAWFRVASRTFEWFCMVLHVVLNDLCDSHDVCVLFAILCGLVGYLNMIHMFKNPSFQVTFEATFCSNNI